ncbi:MAG: SEC-C metal-binding domain-containing protein [Eubacteriales bacterium]
MNNTEALQKYVIKVDGRSQEELLQGYKVARLQEIAKLLGVEKANRLKKQELVEAIVPVVTDSQRLKQEALLADDKVYQFFSLIAFGKKFRTEELEAPVVGYLADRGLAFLVEEGEHLRPVLSTQVETLLDELKSQGLADERRALRYRLEYMKAETNLYGVMPLEMGRRLYELHENPEVSGEEWAKTAQLFAQGGLLHLQEDMLVNACLLEDERWKKVAEAQQHKPWYQPDKYDLLRYENDFYYESTPEILNLRDFLLHSIHADSGVVDQVLLQIHAAIRMGYGAQEVFQMLDRSGIRSNSEKQARRAVNLVLEVLNHTRLWANRGFTPTELHAMRPKQQTEVRVKQQPVRVQKIGRNDPCPCGSGKKYKKCCGR